MVSLTAHTAHYYYGLWIRRMRESKLKKKIKEFRASRGVKTHRLHCVERSERRVRADTEYTIYTSVYIQGASTSCRLPQLPGTDIYVCVSIYISFRSFCVRNIMMSPLVLT